MKQLMIAAMLTSLITPPPSLFAVTRVRISVGVGHPIRRPLPTVVVRPLRRNVVVAPRVTYLAPVVWGPAVVVLPARQRLVWQDSETIRRNEEWVESNFGVGNRGSALFLELRGQAHLNFAEVTFGNGQVQVVDFNESLRPAGVYKLLDFRDGREVEAVRVVARSKTPNSRMTVYLEK
jgi:hypothetical protein